MLPFTEAQFLDVFAGYNGALWPAVIGFWLATLALSAQLVRGRARSSLLCVFAAAHWAWTGAIYHALFFTRINPAAWWFAGIFVAQALGFLWFAIGPRRLTFDWGRRPRHLFAGVFLGYSLLYPALILLTGHEFPRAPAFAVPCPTTIFTAGLLLAVAPPVPRWLFVVPVLWSFIGASAALFLGMTPDLVLVVAGSALAIYAVAPTVFNGQPARV